ncbi:MAG: response regulator transcription factor [Alphaproteobacteria bacterium]|nr:response regulator transcription factor [Alphaproteobacteria bacterium]
MRILIVEPSFGTSQKLEADVTNEYRNIVTADSADEGMSIAKRYDFDIILVNSVLDEGTGTTFMRRLRAAKRKTPIIVYGNLFTDLHTKVTALGQGADDFITYPCHKDELNARIEAVVRRTRGYADPVIEVGNFSISMERKTVEVGGEKVHMTTTEFLILELLAMRQNTAISRETIFDHAYGGLDEPEMKIIDVFMTKIRKKLRNAGIDDLIQTVHGCGYMMVNKEALAEAKANAQARKAQAYGGTAQGNRSQPN